MNKENIIKFFDDASARWDEIAFDNTAKIQRILNYADITENCRVLDVACGTGVLTPHLIERRIESVTGIDISPNMVHIAKEKFASHNNVTFLNLDAEELFLKEKFDRIIIFDAFPHFCNPQKVIEVMHNHLTPNGRLTIAHSMGRKQLDLLHEKTAGAVSHPLLPTEDMMKLLSPYFSADIVKDENDFYAVSAVRK